MGLLYDLFQSLNIKIYFVEYLYILYPPVSTLISGNDEIEAEAIKCIEKFGVGSCGPRAFYGTADIHVYLEEKLAQFFGCEQACLYAYGFSTIASATPAYAKKGDVIFVDEAVNFAIQKSLDASRSRIKGHS